MRFTTTLNNQKCMEWGLNASQGILVSLLYEANSWAKEIILEDKVYYFVSRNLVLQELPMFFEKADTVYRTLKVLAEKGIIEYIKYKNMDLIRLTEKGKTWNFIKNNSEKNPTLEENSEKFPSELGKKSENNSEKNPTLEENSEKFPSELGKKSENNSEKNPTYKDTNKHKDINNNIKEKINKKEILIEHIQELDMEQERKEIFVEWIEYKQEIKNQYSSKKSIDILINQWKNYDISTLRAALEKSIANGYKGLFVPKEPIKPKSYNPDSIDNMEVFR